MKTLLTFTAIIEAGTGFCLLAVPAAIARLLLGATLDTTTALTVARVAGTALLSLGLACWLGRMNGRALVAALLLYNVLVSGILAHAALRLALSGLGLWPVVALHLAFAFWCVAGLRTKRTGTMAQITQFKAVSKTENPTS